MKASNTIIESFLKWSCWEIIRKCLVISMTKDEVGYLKCLWRILISFTIVYVWRMITLKSTEVCHCKGSLSSATEFCNLALVFKNALLAVCGAEKPQFPSRKIKLHCNHGKHDGGSHHATLFQTHRAQIKCNYRTCMRTTKAFKLQIWGKDGKMGKTK